MPDTDLALLIRQDKQLTEAFADFVSFRQVWDNMLRRRSKATVDPRDEAWANGFDYQSAALEHYLGQYVDIDMLNITKIDLVPQDTEPQAKKDIEDVRVYMGSQWRKLNDGRRLDKARAEGVNRYGVAIEHLFASPKDASEGPEPENPDDWGDDNNFHIEPVNPRECGWMPLDRPKLFIQHSKVSYIEGRNLRRSGKLGGGWVDLDSASKKVILGDRRPVDPNEATVAGMPELHVITRAWEDPEDGVWKIGEYIYPEGSSDIAADTVTLDESLVPFRRCPYFIIPSGAERPFETDPHLRFRPRMYGLFVTYQVINYWRNNMAIWGSKLSSGRNLYSSLSKMDPRLAAVWEEAYPVEGAGANRHAVFQMPDPGSNEIMIMPEILAVPGELAEGATLSLKMAEEEALLFTPNRFQAPDPGGRVVEDAKATVYLGVSEHSSLPFDVDLKLIDGRSTQPELEAIRDCLIYWAEGVTAAGGKPQRYYTVTTGGEPLIRGAPDAGKRIWVDARKLARHYQISVLTRNQTEAERQQATYMALAARAQGLATDLQTFEAIGVDDPNRQAEMIEEERQQKALAPKVNAAIDQTNLVIFTALTGIPDLPGLMGLPLPQPSAAPTNPNEPNELIVGREGQAKWGPAAFANTLPPPPPEPMQQQQMQPPVVPSPQGGSLGS